MEGFYCWPRRVDVYGRLMAKYISIKTHCCREIIDRRFLFPFLLRALLNWRKIDRLRRRRVFLFFFRLRSS